MPTPNVSAYGCSLKASLVGWHLVRCQPHGEKGQQLAPERWRLVVSPGIATADSNLLGTTHVIVLEHAVAWHFLGSLSRFYINMYSEGSWITGVTVKRTGLLQVSAFTIVALSSIPFARALARPSLRSLNSGTSACSGLHGSICEAPPCSLRFHGLPGTLRT